MEIINAEFIASITETKAGFSVVFGRREGAEFVVSRGTPSRSFKTLAGARRVGQAYVDAKAGE